MHLREQRTRCILLACLGLLISWASLAQDTITVMHHNLTNYGNSVTGCDATPAQVRAKEANFRIIANHVRPTVVTTNEMSSAATYTNRFRDTVLNRLGYAVFRSGVTANYCGSSLVNGFFYDTAKIGLLNQYAVNGPVRVIDIYRTYVKQPGLASGADTAYLWFIVQHLKAGNTTTDANQRASMTTALMNRLASFGAQNYLLCGDYNVYTNTEQGFQNLVNPSNARLAFRDPVNRLGAWNNNRQYADVHTQSPRTTGTACFSGGGMDDRFDFILASTWVMEDSALVRYIPNTYKAVGNDGNRFNLDVNGSGNNSAPVAVLNAIWNSTDHLPVTAKFRVTQAPTAVSRLKKQTPWKFWGTASTGEVLFQAQGLTSPLDVQISTLTGQVYSQFRWNAAEVETLRYSLPAGLYLVRARDTFGHSQIQKIWIP